MKNAYAAKLQAKRVHLRNSERAELIHRILTTVYQASAVALNEQFGFGADRIEKYREALDATICEYGELGNGADWDYADGKLEQRYERIMGKPDKQK